MNGGATLNTQQTITNHFPFSICANLVIDKWAGSLSSLALVKQIIHEREMQLESNLTDLANMTVENLNEVQSIYRHVEELERELCQKTLLLRGEEPTDVAFFGIPDIIGTQDEFAICGITRIDNNGGITIFSPIKEYLLLFGTETREW